MHQAFVMSPGAIRASQADMVLLLKSYILLRILTSKMVVIIQGDKHSDEILQEHMKGEPSQDQGFEGFQGRSDL